MVATDGDRADKRAGSRWRALSVLIDLCVDKNRVATLQETMETMPPE